VRSLVLFLKGTVTEMALDEIREGSRITCTGIGGSGGIVEGRVRKQRYRSAGIFFRLRHSMRLRLRSAVGRGEELKLWRRKDEMGGREIRGG